MRVLLSEGSSTSAREAITVLGLTGHEVEICDPDPRCLGRFSRFVRRFHRCPGLGVDPDGYLAFIIGLVSDQRFDAMLPIHEQGYLFAPAADRIREHVAVALPSFASYDRALGKVSFSRLLTQLSLPQPATRYGAGSNVPPAERYPIVLKSDIGTASRGVWIVNDEAGLKRALFELVQAAGPQSAYLMQDFVAGTIEHAQAVFDRGRLLASHAYRQIARGAGGGDAIKESIAHPVVRDHLTRIGAVLDWHGALSVDYIVDPRAGGPLYIDCNPRLVEPMSAWLAGLDLVGLLIRVSRGETPDPPPPSRVGVRTHLSMQALLGAALRGADRGMLLRECGRLAARIGPYNGSREELTPIRLDWPSAVPCAVAAVWMLVKPQAAHDLPQKGWGAHLLSPGSVRKIRNMAGAETLDRGAAPDGLAGNRASEQEGQA